MSFLFWVIGFYCHVLCMHRPVKSHSAGQPLGEQNGFARPRMKGKTVTDIFFFFFFFLHVLPYILGKILLANFNILNLSFSVLSLDCNIKILEIKKNSRTILETEVIAKTQTIASNRHPG